MGIVLKMLSKVFFVLALLVGCLHVKACQWMPQGCSNNYTYPYVGSTCCRAGCTVFEACENCFVVSCSHYGSDIPLINDINVISSDSYAADFSFNEISIILEGSFFTTQIYTSLDLSHNLLTFLYEGALTGLDDILVTLDLSHNALTSVPRDALIRMNFLKQLNLDYNNIREITRDSVDGIMDTLEAISVDYCGVMYIEPETFIRVHNLKHLSVRGNLLDDIGFICTQPLNELVSIDMSGLSLRRVDQYCFKGATSLETVYLEDNELSNLEFARHTRSLKYLYIARNRLHYLDACDLIGLPLRFGAGLIDYSDNPIRCSCELAWLATQSGLSTRCEDPLEVRHLTLTEYVTNYCVPLRDTDFVCTQIEITNADITHNYIILKWSSLVTEKVEGFIVSVGGHFSTGSEYRQLAVDNRTFDATLVNLRSDSEYHVCVSIVTFDATFGQRQCLTLQTDEYIEEEVDTGELGGDNVDEKDNSHLLMYRIMCTVFLSLLCILIIVVIILACKLRVKGQKIYGPSFINTTYGKITKKFKRYTSNNDDSDGAGKPPPPPISSLPDHVKSASGSDYSTSRTHSHSMRSDTTLPLPPIPHNPYHNVTHTPRNRSIDRADSATIELTQTRMDILGASDYEELAPRVGYIEGGSIGSRSISASIDKNQGYPPIPESPPENQKYENDVLHKSSF